MISLNDHAQRDQAVHSQHSFIVHAPAGSGKTELLVQRYLKLLSHSPFPEAVRAFTFTRKAADEMRQRVLDTLHFVASSQTPLRESYQRTRWELGKQLYAWQAFQGWDLLNNPQRLQIQTIDAFYAEIVSRASHSKISVTYSLVEDPTPLYREAVHKLLDDIGTDSKLSNALIKLASHVNNDMNQLEQRLVHMLSYRDQWIDFIPKRLNELSSLRFLLENSLEAIHVAAYKTAAAALKKTWYSPLDALLVKCAGLKNIKSPLAPHLFWPLLADLFLTAKGTWRQTIPSNNLRGYTHSEQQALKTSITYWLQLFSQQEPLRIALLAIRKLPPNQYTELQWEILCDLFCILSALRVIMETVFQKHGQFDYIEVALKAYQLLDNEATFLFKDNEIQHILIDEFQDTSVQQLKFLERLLRGWQPHDGKTLFLVGDPMQSIYRFRKAEARLFKRVQQKGIACVNLRLITLSMNFRSSLQLVKWTNHHFKAMQDRFIADNLLTPAVAENTLKDVGKVETHWLSNATTDQEVEQVITVLRQAMSKKASVAILGRARQHLLPVVLKLRTENMAHHAVEIETLADKPIIQDLLALTRALSHLADDVAWLALLRAPWCGITLTDLHILMQACHSEHSAKLIWEQLCSLDTLKLSKDAQLRLAHFVKVLAPMVDSYGRMPLSERVIEAWYVLKGPLTQPLYTWHSEDITRFRECVDALQKGETILDVSVLEAKLHKIYATPENDQNENAVNLMTIHKAKGLEFDIVIVLSLHRSTRKDTYPLILFDESPADSLLLAPIKASDATQPDAMYGYLRQLDSKQHQAEMLRLLYVACTRAKRELHLIGSVSSQKEEAVYTPKTGTFLELLWPVLDARQKVVAPMQTATDSKANTYHLRRAVLSTKDPWVDL